MEKFRNIYKSYLGKMKFSGVEIQYKIRKNIKRFFVVIGILVIGIALPIALKLVSRQIEYKKTPAQELAAYLSIVPASETIPPNKTFRVMVNSGSNKLSFVRVSLMYDASKIDLAGEITTTPLISRIIKVTRLNEPATTGTIVIALAVPPGEVMPAGEIELASFSMKAVSTQENDTAGIYFVSSDTQVVDENAISLNKIVSDANIVLNPPPPTPTAAPIDTPTPTPTPTNVPTSTPTPAPTATPMPTVIPTATPRPTGGVPRE